MEFLRERLKIGPPLVLHPQMLTEVESGLRVLPNVLTEARFPHRTLPLLPSRVR